MVDQDDATRFKRDEQRGITETDMIATFSVVRCSREFTMEMPARISGNAVNGVSHPFTVVLSLQGNTCF